MIQELCVCNFSIPGVKSLPPHDHNQARLAENLTYLNPDNIQVQQIVKKHYPLRDSVKVHVDWRKVARAISTGAAR